MKKTAILLGASGLVGGYVLNNLLDDNRYEKIILFGRKNLNINHQKIEENIIDFDELDKSKENIHGDDLFCCLGTTLKKAGSKEKFYIVDHDIPVEIAEYARENNVSGCFIVSSIGAKAESKNYYLNAKGEMENDILSLNFERTGIARPSMLLGERKETRIAESLGKAIMPLINFLLVGKMKKYRSIHAGIVAKAMVQIANGNYTQKIFESDELKELAKK